MMNKNRFIKFRKIISRKFFKFLSIFLVILFAITLILFRAYSLEKSRPQIILENPINRIVFEHTSELGEINWGGVIEQATLEFNGEYINYIIIALGAGNLHKSYTGYGNPIIELNIDGEVWTSEISNSLVTSKTSSEKEDLRISLTRREAIEAILSPDIKSFMKTSVINGNTQIEMVAGKVELASKGYLAMYNGITGEDVKI
ncbi:hypothetical protein HOD75_03285 [archaeon]|jgi:hypothetical protein|nr:hypothetical protein [archaeon]MBT4241897.1 hypothetical protein [archaeon]MBT4418444.1 hypothetical protein [archaeon]